jgi:hypothetical protein
MDPATSNTVIAIATAVNVVVTTIYAIFTWRLWQETRRQAGLTGQQAAQTREMFEATHRPWISIEPFRQYDFSTSSVRLAFRLRNHGSSPAFVTRWVRRWDFASGPPQPLAPEAGDGVSWCIFPDGTGEALEIVFGDPHGVWQRGTRFEVAALYHGTDGRLRRTRLVATLRIKGSDTFDLDAVWHEAC